ncbi:MAG: prepilin-type N-terminal cleavage/methylation domain-containing protein, partial [Chthoniobacterales bacterium]
MRKKTQGFTLIEIAISIFILLLILMLAVPSMSGVLADRRLRRSLDAMNDLVRTAQERSVNEHRA